MKYEKIKRLLVRIIVIDGMNNGYAGKKKEWKERLMNINGLSNVFSYCLAAQNHVFKKTKRPTNSTIIALEKDQWEEIFDLLDEEMIDKEKELSQKQTEIDSEKNQINSLQNNLTTKNSELTQLETKKKDLEKQITSLTNEKKEAEQSKKDLIDKLNN